MATETVTFTQAVLFGATVPKIGGGFCASYNLRTFAAAIAAGTLSVPCILTVDTLKVQPGFKPQTFLGGQPEQDITFEQHYLHCEVAGNADITYLDPDMRTMRDTYIAALQADPFMTANASWRNGGATLAYQKVPTVSHQLMRYEWLDRLFYANVFTIATGIYL
jgi:hypothetical protein